MKHLFILKSYYNGTELYSFELKQNKMLIGSDKRCDIYLDSNAISNYHAILFVKEDSIILRDLESINGIILNNQRVQEATLCENDSVTIGDITFILEQISTKQPIVKDLDQNITQVEIQQPIQILKPIEGLTVIDGEYCDITFLPQKAQEVNLDLPHVAENYVDFDEEYTFQQPILSDTTGKYIQFELSVAGTIIDSQIRKLKDSTYYLGQSNRPTVFCLEGVSECSHIPVVTISNETIKPHDLETFDLIQDKDTIIYQKYDLRLNISIVENIPTTKWAPFFEFDRYFQKINAKTMGSILGLALMLLLIDTSLPPKPKKVAIIYKLQKKIAKKMKANDPVNNHSNPGTNKVDAPPKQQLARKKSSKRKMEKLHKKIVKVAKQQTAKPVKKKSPIRTYKFKSSKALANFLHKKTKINIKTATATSTATSSAIVTSAATVEDVAYQGVSDIKTRQPGSISRKGSLNSLGGRGLISKEGIDTSFATTKTIVLGSMDPELLRKILRRYLPQFRQCYQQELLAQNKRLEGVISLDFRIGKQGRVINSNIHIKKATFSNKGTHCMNRVLSLIKFPKPKGGGFVDVTQPLNFYAEREIIN